MKCVHPAFVPRALSGQTGRWFDAGRMAGDARPRTPRVVVDEPTRIDRVFGLLTMSAGLTVLVLLVLVGVFLFLRAQDALDVAGWSFFTTEDWRTDIDPPEIGVLGLLAGTVLV